jgi:hypothetical protein
MNFKSELSPIIISSPTTRSGTTLLQRLCCSSSNGLIYGETCAHDIDQGINLFLSKNLYLGIGSNWRDEQMESVLKGEVNDWITDLMPNHKQYLSNQADNINSYLSFLNNFAEENNREIWGVKMAGWNPNQLKNTLEFIPKAKLVFLIRDLPSCVKSAKKEDMIHTLEEIRQFSIQWKNTINFVQQHLNHAKLIISYSDLIQDTDRVLGQLETFTGLKNIDKTILDKKINTLSSSSESTAYNKPAELNQEEKDLLAEFII